MPLYEHICPVGHIKTVLVKIHQRNTPTKCTCGEKTRLKISAVKTHFDGSDPDFHDSHARWVKSHEKANGKDDPENLIHVYAQTKCHFYLTRNRKDGTNE